MQDVVRVAAPDPRDGVLIPKHRVDPARVFTDAYQLGERWGARLGAERLERAFFFRAEHPPGRLTLCSEFLHEHAGSIEPEAHDGAFRTRWLWLLFYVDAAPL